MAYARMRLNDDLSLDIDINVDAVMVGCMGQDSLELVCPSKWPIVTLVSANGIRTELIISSLSSPVFINELIYHPTID